MQLTAFQLDNLAVTSELIKTDGAIFRLIKHQGLKTEGIFMQFEGLPFEYLGSCPAYMSHDWG